MGCVVRLGFTRTPSSANRWSTFLLTGAALALVRFTRRETVSWLALAGGALGLVLLTRASAAAALPAFGAYVAMYWRTKRLPWQSVVRQAYCSRGSL